MLNPCAIAGPSTESQLLLSRVSHEIRNPAALINSFLQLLSGKYPELLRDSYYQRILENLHYLNDLLDELTIYNHSHNAVKEERNPYVLLQEIAADAGRTLEYKGISIELVKESAIPRIPLDAVKFRQLCYNLIRNAAEAMPEGGAIRLLLSCDGSFLRLRVCDTGCGIAAEDLPTLFDLFVTHKKDGTGLGLAICREIANAHGGDIFVESVPGRGSVFTVSLPVA